jgi:protein SCO1/2
MRSVSRWGSLAGVGLALALLAGCADRRPYRGIALDPPTPAPALRVTDAGGRTFDLAAERGRVVLLFFGYTHCPDICPATLARWARLREALGPAAEQVRFVFVSVDPDRDTPRVAQQYAQRFHASFVGLAPPAAELARLQDAFKVASYPDPHEPGGDYTMGHSSQTFVVDRDGRLRLVHPVGSTVEDYRADVARLLD